MFMGAISAARRRSAGSAGTVILQVQPSGADGSTTFTDQSPFARTLTAEGDAQVDTGILDSFGFPTAQLDGVGDFIRAEHSTDFDFGTGAWTIEAWIRWTSFATFGGIISKSDSSGGNDSWYFRLNNGQLQFGSKQSVPAAFAEHTGTGSSFSTGTFYHVAACRASDGKISLFDSGVRRYQSGAFTQTIQSGTIPVRVGCGVWTGSNRLNGRVGGVRITKGAALYDGATYTVPTARFPTP